MSTQKHVLFNTLILLFMLAASMPSWAQGIEGCDADFVSLGGKSIEVTPTGVDDTGNIQCALEAVGTITGGVPGVRLSAGTFFISNIIVENYKGYFQGETRDTTSLIVSNGSINCAALNSGGQVASALKFIKGEPLVRFMTIELGITTSTTAAIEGLRTNKTKPKPQAVQIVSPCLDPNTPLNSYIHFTGKSADDPGCTNDVIFAEVDRVNLIGGGRGTGLVAGGILAAPEGETFGGCKNTLLGQVTVNRSWIGNFDAGVYTALRGGAHTDVTFTTFWDNKYGLFITNSNQTTTVSNNIFDVKNTGPTPYTAGIYLTALGESAPADTQLIVVRNNFRMLGLDGNTVDAVGFYNADDNVPLQNIRAFVASNIFQLSGDDVAGVWSDGVNNGTVSGNSFSGDGLVAVEVLTPPGFPLSGWTITGNGDLRDFLAADADIWIGPRMWDTFIGDGQFHTLHDEGSNTHSFGAEPASKQGKTEKLSPNKARGTRRMETRRTGTR